MPKNKKLDVNEFVLNCVPSIDQQDDWTMDDAISAGYLDVSAPLPEQVDLRLNWWKVDNQGSTGACVGYATAYGVLRWHYYKKNLIPKRQKPSARFIWMANKETDTYTTYPTTFLESTGTYTKLALKVAQKYGCVLDSDLPMNGHLSTLKQSVFYSRAAKHRITSYNNLGDNLDDWRKWIAFNGPILVRLDIDTTWDNATHTGGHLKDYIDTQTRGGHAVCLVGYTQDYFIVRNSWGEQWGDKGFAYAANKYTKAAFTEAYGAVI